MKLVFSRKGFDTTAGGVPSPIIDGVPVSLPIPTQDRSCTRFADRDLGELVSTLTRGRIDGAHLCHDDPMFADGLCWFGQCGAAQGHLARHGVGPGDHFLFFGLFADPETGERHHRIFAHMGVEACGSPEAVRRSRSWQEPPRPHPHAEGEWPANNAIWFGPGATARSAADGLRLTQPCGPLNRWRVPPWLKQRGLTYHDRPDRWIGRRSLDSARRGQEFVCDIGRAREPRLWLEGMIALIENRPAG
ncbi:hypothetical protein [Novosphingobium sp. KN65.2]|uniref:Nmad3 family putative nucleotide modification protein n=1 Tax=Novosphingobium sp. KN65.2 TaxID=1478134 RepID=UPI0005E6F6D6|nr:hypothetical protein [Novosphingobium sp. KN65.2]CDO38837.1 conserved hypothetical protein [Novosphingobium sp. KN65.2]